MQAQILHQRRLRANPACQLRTQRWAKPGNIYRDRYNANATAFKFLGNLRFSPTPIGFSREILKGRVGRPFLLGMKGPLPDDQRAGANAAV